jgi:DNA-binding MarR family transcriptional regulator
MPQERRFAELLSQVAREITLRQAADVCCGELTLEQFQTLQAVSAADSLSIGALSARLRVALSTMSRNVSVLERNGYLLRARSAEDGRIVHVSISPKGKRALESLRCDERDVFADVYQRLPAGDRPRVITALEVLRTCLDASNGAGDACCPPIPIRKSPPIPSPRGAGRGLG